MVCVLAPHRLPGISSHGPATPTESLQRWEFATWGHQVACELTSTTLLRSSPESTGPPRRLGSRSAGAARSPGGRSSSLFCGSSGCPGLAVQWCRLRRCSAVAVEHVHRLVRYPGQPLRYRGLRQ